MTVRLLPFLLSFLLLSGCQAPAEPAPTLEATTAPIVTATPEPTAASDPIWEQVRALSDEELAGQVLVVGIQGGAPGEDGAALLEEVHPGGIILFSRNVADPEQLSELTNGLKAMNAQEGNLPLFLCVDEEGGRVSRMPEQLADLPAAYDYAQAGGDSAALGRALAAECAAFGFSVDFAPVLDVWSNPDNTVIGKRAFGTEARAVAAFGPQVAAAMAEGGVIPVGKHFPGHGDTAADSHSELPVVDKSREDLEEGELLPFRAAMEEGLPAVMVGHILLTEIDPVLPSSLSPLVVDGLLRQELGFEGVVFTDDLTMGAVAQGYSLDQAVVLSLRAGCDMALVCHGLDNARAAHGAVLAALRSGELSRERLEKSVYRILSLKAEFGVEDRPVAQPDVEGLNGQLREIIP